MHVKLSHRLHAQSHDAVSYGLLLSASMRLPSNGDVDAANDNEACIERFTHNNDRDKQCGQPWRLYT